VAVLISGTGQPVLALLFWAAVIGGAIEQIRRKPWFGVTLVALYPLHALALMISRPESAQSAIVLARYCMPLVPVSILLAACGMIAAVEAIGRRIQMKPELQEVTGYGCVLALAATGPLPQTYVSPNSFTSHGAYQHRYGLIDWRQSFHSDIEPPGFPLRTFIRVNEVCRFYAELAEHPSEKPIIEYPMLIGDAFNPLYYYQHFHHRRVLVGYTTGLIRKVGLAAGNIYGNTYIDQVLGLIGDPAQVRFRNLVSMDDLAAMRGSGAEYVIVHKFYEADLPGVAPPPSELERLLETYRKTLGAAVYEDERVVAFKL
jgi:hypothetical protein